MVAKAKPAKTMSFWQMAVQEFLKCFRSVHLAIILLSLLGVGTLIGVITPQEGMSTTADIQKQFGMNYGFLNTLGFFNVFSSFWFITLQVLFFFNLLVGSFQWLKPATIAAVRQYTIKPHVLQHKGEAQSLIQPALGNRQAVEKSLMKVLKKFRYQVHRDGDGNLYASKGNMTRLGPAIAHVGILLCLIAGVYSSFTGFKAVRMATPGETFAIPEADTFKTNVPQSFWLGNIPTWKLHIKDFHIVYYPDHPETAQQYYSTVQVVSPQGKPLKEQTISVNHPLLYDNLTIYQASFAPTGRFILNVDGKPHVVGINGQFNGRSTSITPLGDGSMLIMFPFFAGQDPGVSKNYGVFFVRRPTDVPTPGRMPENRKLQQGQSAELKGHRITYVQPEMQTGLQIKRALEVPLMYLSYLIISVGAALCFFTQRRIWVALRPLATQSDETEVMLYAQTNKARLSFRKELLALLDAMNDVIRTSRQTHVTNSLQSASQEKTA